MPKYTNDIIAGYTLYFTSKCIVEAMHVHASDKALNADAAAKLYVYENGESLIKRKGMVSDKDMKLIQEYIRLNHEQMYEKWKKYSETGYYKK